MQQHDRRSAAFVKHVGANPSYLDVGARLSAFRRRWGVHSGDFMSSHSKSQAPPGGRLFD
jgi:hypothetical protein